MLSEEERQSVEFHSRVAIKNVFRETDPDRVAKLFVQTMMSGIVVGDLNSSDCQVLPIDAPPRLREIAALIPGATIEGRIELIEEAKLLMLSGKGDGMNQTQRDADRVAEIMESPFKRPLPGETLRDENPGSRRDAPTGQAQVRINVSFGPTGPMGALYRDGARVEMEATFRARGRRKTVVVLTPRDNVFGIFERFLGELRQDGRMDGDEPVDFFGDERAWQRAKNDVGSMHARDYAKTTSGQDFIRFGTATFWKDSLGVRQWEHKPSPRSMTPEEYKKWRAAAGEVIYEDTDSKFVAGVDHGSKDGTAVAVLKVNSDGHVVVLSVWHDGGGSNLTLASGGIRAIRRVDKEARTPHDQALKRGISELLGEMKARLGLSIAAPIRVDVDHAGRELAERLYPQNGYTDQRAVDLMKHAVVGMKPGDKLVCAIDSRTLVVQSGATQPAQVYAVARTVDKPAAKEDSAAKRRERDEAICREQVADELAESEEDLAISIFRRRLRAEAEEIAGSREWSSPSAARQAPHGGKGFRHPQVTLPDAPPPLVVPARCFREEVERVFSIMWEKTKPEERRLAELEAEETLRELGDLLLIKAKLGKRP